MQNHERIPGKQKLNNNKSAAVKDRKIAAMRSAPLSSTRSAGLALHGRLSRSEFKAADRDSYGTLSRDEYLAAVHTRFNAADVNGEGPVVAVKCGSAPNPGLTHSR